MLFVRLVETALHFIGAWKLESRHDRPHLSRDLGACYVSMLIFEGVAGLKVQ